MNHIKQFIALLIFSLIACNPTANKQILNPQHQVQQQIKDLKKVGEYNILIGAFHDHWERTGQDNPALFMAALDYYHYDFTCLMDGDSIYDPMTKKGIEAYSKGKKIFLGKEQTYGWGHVVTVRNHPENVNNTNADFREEIAKLKAGGGFVALAHPASFPETNRLMLQTGEIDSMLRLGIIDAWQPELKAPEIELIEEANKAGKTIPIVCGWDVHYVVDLPDLPAALYTEDRTPNGHLDSGGRYRNIVIDAENNFESIIAAVKAGRAVVEDLRAGPNQGKLYGEQKWVDYLIANGYKQQMAQLDDIRRSKTLKLDKDYVKVGESLRLQFSEPCTVLLPGNLTAPTRRKTDANGVLNIDKMPPLLDRDMTFYPVVALYKDGFEKDFVITLHHRFSFDVYPTLENGKHYLRVALSDKLNGVCSAMVENNLIAKQSFSGDEILLDISDLPIDFSKAVSFTVTVKDDNQIERTFASYVNYTIAPKFKGSWDDIPSVSIASEDLEIAPGYGTTRAYPGSEVIDGEVKFAWNDQYFMMRAKVTDATNFNPFMSSKSYQGDVIQMGIDPMLSRKRSLGNNHSFNLSLSPKGPLMWRWKSAVEERKNETNIKEDFSLGDKYMKISKWENGIIYEVKLPWSELAPAHPVVGKQLGLYLLLANNDGDGFLDMFGWPSMVPNGGYLKPNTWGFLTLTE